MLNKFSASDSFFADYFSLLMFENIPSLLMKLTTSVIE